MNELKELLSKNINTSIIIREENELKDKYNYFVYGKPPFSSLYNYITNIPEQYYSEEVLQLFYEFLNEKYEEDPKQFVDLLDSISNEISNAILAQNIINSEDIHEQMNFDDEYTNMLIMDKHILPNYLKMLEGVFSIFIYLLAYQLRTSRNKSTEKLDIYNSIKEIEKTKYNILSTPYNNIIRNGIAHGNFNYTKDNILFFDKKNVIELSYSKFLKIFDTLTDFCNSLIISIKLFYNSKVNSSIKIPKQIMIEELKSKVESPWWYFRGTIESTSINSQKQLLIFVEPRTTDKRKVIYSSVATGILSEYYSPGYNRYLVLFRSKLCYPGCVAFNGDLIKDNRLSYKNKIEDYKDIIENNLLFFIPRYKLPNIIYKINTLFHSFRINIPPVIKEISKNYGHIEYIVKDAKIHRNGWRYVLNGKVVIKDIKNINEDDLKNNFRKIIKKSFRNAKSSNRKFILSILPLGFARISVYSKNMRKRDLDNVGLAKELICTIQIKKIKKIRIPDIYNSKIELYKNIRIAWNHEWIKNN